MTIIGGGGVIITGIDVTERFKRDRKKLPREIRDKLDSKLRDLLASPRPPGLRFEKLSGYRNPDIYTIHVTGNYKISFEINGNIAKLRRVACHNDIDRQP